MIAQVIYLSDGIDENSIWGRPGLRRYNPFSINCLGFQRLHLHQLLFCKWPRCAQSLRSIFLFLQYIVGKKKCKIHI